MHGRHVREPNTIAIRIESAYRPDIPLAKRVTGRIVTVERLPALIFECLAATVPHLFSDPRGSSAC